MSKKNNINYKWPPGIGQILKIGTTELEVLKKNQQLALNSKESGGFLFAEINVEEIIIKVVSEPIKDDLRSRCGIVINRTKRQSLINKMHSRGLHFIGEWHTHPESNPTPSKLDLKSMNHCFTKSYHSHPYFIMIIVGNSKDTLNLHVSAHNASKYIVLQNC